LKQQLTTWKSPSLPRKKKPQQDSSKGKAMLEMFFLTHVEFIPEGGTVNKHRYKQILHRLRNINLVQEELAVVPQQHPFTLLCACPRGAGKTTGRLFATPSILT
jgi:hypothetical protein